MNEITTGNNRTRRINIRMTEQEYQLLIKNLSATNDRKLSAYARKLLLGRPVKVLSRNHSLDLFIEEAAKLRSELSAVGKNFNQIVRRINGTPKLPHLEFWLNVARDMEQQLNNKVGCIESYIAKFSERWLQG